MLILILKTQEARMRMRMSMRMKKNALAKWPSAARWAADGLA